MSFDNSAAAGGAPQPAAYLTAWVAGTLAVDVLWSGGSLLMYPDTHSARLLAQALDAAGNPAATLATKDFSVPAPHVSAFVLHRLVPDPAGNVVYAITTPPLPSLHPASPSASLTLTGTTAAGAKVTERFAVRPAPADPSSGLPTTDIVASLPAGPQSRLITNPGIFTGQPAVDLVRGVTLRLTVDVPLVIAIGQRTARGQASVNIIPARWGSTPRRPSPTRTIRRPPGPNQPRRR